MKYCLSLLLLFSSLCLASTEPVVFGVHSNTAPLEWRKNGVDQGFNIELLKRIGQLTGHTIHPRRKSFQQLVRDVQNPDSDIDVICVVSPVAISREAQQSDPIYATHAKAYTLQGKSFINNWQDLAGKRVAIKVGSFVDVYLRGHPQNFIRIDVDLYETGFKMLLQKRVDVVLAENFVARRLQPLYPSVRSASDPLIYGAFNFVSNDKNAALMAEINKALRQLKLSGEYDLLVNKWFGTGREKVDLTSTHEQVMWGSVLIATLAAIGLVFTFSISRRLHKRTLDLDNELEQRRLAERRISQLSRQFQSVLDGLPHGVFLFDRRQECLWSNGKNQAMLESGALLDNLGLHFQLAPLLRMVLNTQKGQVQELHHGQRYWQLQIHPIGQEQAVVMLEDTTAQHKLRQANEQASRLASLGELSAGIAHEINNPTGLIVHAIALFSEAMQDLKPAIEQYREQDPFWLIAGLDPDRALRELDNGSHTIEEGARRIARIVDDLKQYARPVHQASHQKLSLNEVIQVSLRLTANQVKRFAVQTTLAESDPRICGDAQQLQQVMINLIQNACHAMSSDCGVLRLETGQDHQGAYIKVRDNGCGMDQETVQRIKEPFFTTRRHVGGTGLGLSVCSRIINEHNGRWLVDSVPDEGTTMTLYFPEEKHA
ncbi:transporter substrate-binding domain-containing protein [Ferrimonas sediminicola]|uniref:histidine kinase n=1 Tax=Ferrimonas sediminicola TaxID=2569538 RepID=A0A4U1BE53_9GAMM|nr:transporter substrate-binding domain-containing protein [Ferrimonas sediminicola]TKB48907.1 transporter substrate-binding domain-containing protein [Ferrimonas sediminicola]